MFSAAQNLPAVLNDPSRGKQLNLFTKKWGDSFVEKVTIPASPYLVDITYDHVEPYIKRIGRRYRRHVRLNQTTPNIVDQQQRSLSPPSHHHTSFYELNEASINDIPQIFTQPQLDLTNPATFSEVFPGIGESRQHDAGRLLQEKLSHYLDIVEVQIAKQVKPVKFTSQTRNAIICLYFIGVSKIFGIFSCNDLTGCHNGRYECSHRKSTKVAGKTASAGR